MRKSYLIFLLCVSPLPAQERYTDPEYTAEDRSHWSFVPPKRGLAPNGIGHPIDVFIQRKLTDHKLKHAAPADRRTLIRRVTLSLTGLPPTPEEVAAFLKDTSPNAYEKVVDRLLASPHYGERWAQHWLDVVRFAESNGYELDGERPQAWRYRDYVAKAFNDDMPYDRFILEQIAGDELASGKDPKTVSSLHIATGMHRCGPVHVVSGNLDLAMVRQEILTEMVNGITSAFMGITMACARCHDHKFDALSLGDYYRMQAFFGGTRFADVDIGSEEEVKKFKEADGKIQAKIKTYKKAIEAIDAPYRKRIKEEKIANLDEISRKAVETPAEKRTAEQKKIVKDLGGALTIRWDDVLAIVSKVDKDKRDVLRSTIFELEQSRPAPPPSAWALETDPKPGKTYVLKRGDVQRKAHAVEPAVPQVFTGAIVPVKTRTELAQWLTQPTNPLTARVMVNRLWHYHFGRGIVATPNDFGTRGEAPTHPELLDYLALELMNPSNKNDKPWQLKRMHKLIVTSKSFMQESAMAPVGDPQNKWLSVYPRRRLDAEALRDSALAVAGTLNRAVGGPSVKVPLEPEVYDLIFTEDEPDYLWLETADVKQHTRRSLYLFAKRNVKLPMLEAFDQPDTLNSCAARPSSTFAPQALIMMNGPFMREQANALAVMVMKNQDEKEQVKQAYSHIFQRMPTTEELKIGQEFLAGQRKELVKKVEANQEIASPKNLPVSASPVVARALADYCLALLNTNEFAFIP